MMAIFKLIRTVFWAIGNIGISPDTPRTEKKHIRFLNIGILFFGLVCFVWLVRNIVQVKISPVEVTVYIAGLVLCLWVYPLHLRRRYTLARIYSFLLFYGVALFLFPSSGKDIVDHYFIVAAMAWAFLVFPRNQKKLMWAMILIGLLCLAAVYVSYEVFPPAYEMSPSAAEQRNLFISANILAMFFVFIWAGKYFTDRAEKTLTDEHRKLADMTRLLKKMFGRYISTEVMNSLIENPFALELGGVKKRVTMLMSDLRGFTSLSERLQPEQVVHMLNAYLDVMGGVVQKYNGTINGITGDALLIFFGAPQEMPDQTERAVACAIEMQNAMEHVNRENRSLGLPELEMGIGVHEDDVIVGNIGSSQRIKYTVVGRGVNMTSRIESYAAGGQIFVSDTVCHKLRDVLRIDSEKEVLPKGAETPIRIYEVGGLAGCYHLTLNNEDSELHPLVRPVPIYYIILDGKHVVRKARVGSILRLSKRSAEVQLERAADNFANLKMNLSQVEADLITKDFYGKIIKPSAASDKTHVVRFSALPPEVGSYFQALRQHAVISV